MTDPLAEYQRKRDLSKTPEPGPRDAKKKSGDPIFVIQQHAARRMHWDFRLEVDGVLASWAVPKGPSLNPSVKRMAVPTEDHPMSYVDFAGEIPTGNYGAGTVKIWDEGTYDLHKWEPREVMVTLHGDRVQGRYVLFKTRPDSWMIHRMDPPQDPAREPVPEGLRPMRARAGRLPAKDELYGFEIAWGGRRVILYGEGGRVRIETEHRKKMVDVTDRYPELSRLGRALGSHEVVLDGELVALDASEQPVAGVPPDRSDLETDSAVRRAARDHPVAVMLFDLLYLDGHVLMDLAYQERRQRLTDLRLGGSNWQTPAHHVGDGKALRDAARAQGLPGVVAKRLDSTYQPGIESKDWVFVKA